MCLAQAVGPCLGAFGSASGPVCAPRLTPYPTGPTRTRHAAAALDDVTFGRYFRVQGSRPVLEVAMPASARHETRALLRAHLSAASRYRHLTRHCPICHRLLRLAQEPAQGVPEPYGVPEDETPAKG